MGEVIPLTPPESTRPRRARARLARGESGTAVRGMDHATAMESWATALRARNRAPRTIDVYRETIEVWSAWLTETGGPDDVQAVTADHVRAFLAHELGRRVRREEFARQQTPATVDKHYRHLRTFFNWLIKEDERDGPSPVRPDDAPKVPEVEKPPLGDDEVRALLATCKGRAFNNVRDEAILRLFVDSGPRISGLAGIRYAPGTDDHDLDLARYRVRITLKGGDELWVPVGRKTGQAIDRYVRARARHPFADDPWLWLGEQGRLTHRGVEQMLKRRGRAAGVQDVHAHRFRRTSATAFLGAGGSATDAMHIYGWKSEEMVRHYTKETARERARDTHSRLSPGDRF